MTAYEAWQQVNDRYLTEAIARIRARLEALANKSRDAIADVPPPAPSERSRWHTWWNGETASPDRAIEPAATITEDALATTPAPADAEGTPIPAAEMLAARLGLNAFERDVLLLCAAMEFDTRIGLLCAQAQGDPAKTYPTFGLALAMFDDASWDALSPERPLRFWRLIEINQPGARPLIASALKADERIVNYLKGVNYLDDRIAPMLDVVAVDAEALAPSQQQKVDAIVEPLRLGAARGSLPLVQLLGRSRASKLQIAQAVASTLGVDLRRLAADAIPSTAADQETLLRLWQRETALLNLALIVDAADLDRASPQGISVQRLLSRMGGVCLVDVREPWAGLARDSFSIDVDKPTPLEQRAAWTAALGDDAAQHAARTATHFDFEIGTIRRIAADALAASADDRSRLPGLLWSYSLARGRPTLDQLAQRIDARAVWDDLKLPANEKSLLRQIADQAEHRSLVYDDWGFRDRLNRGLCISVLFAGPSGTGKTMAAEVIARELDLPLYRVDLSTVVNKYIGETEKNLRRLFDAADDGGAILHCDECDALFGKRSEVKDSHDRHANIEIDYLLQRIESFRGLAILTTNMKSALDTAFLRRLRFVVNFPFPSAAERAAIWRAAFPSGMKIGNLDFDQLARFDLTGGSIHNIALNAAFLAARDLGRVTMPIVLEAARAEYRKLDKAVNEADFRWLETVGSSA